VTVTDDGALLALFRAIDARDEVEIAQRLGSSRDLASRATRTGASREDAEAYFLPRTRHHVYAGDTALHVAAAAYRRGLAESLVASGADVRARNRRGAQPLHYAADGSPGTPRWDPMAQADVIVYLVGAGADPDALDKSGVAPLHRAVRTRSSAAVRALVENGAVVRLMNGNGSTPLHLAVQSTGRSGSGTAAAKDEQRLIIAVLLEHGASPSDADANGRTVRAAASSEWVRELLFTHG
jgi:ankyrin repeat protein